MLSPGAAYKGILSVVRINLTTQCPPQHVPRVPGPSVGKGAGLTRVKKLDKGRQGGGEALTWVRHGNNTWHTK